MNRLQEGVKAPNFTLPNEHGEPTSLTSLLEKGRVLLYFYPKAMTPGCTVQAQNLRDQKQALADKNTIAVGVSIDAPKRLAKFIERDELNFTLLGDEDHAVAEAFGVWGLKKFMGREYDGIHRISFLIEQDGTISKVFDTFKTKDHHEVVLAAL